MRRRARKCAEGGRDECRKVKCTRKHAETRGGARKHARKVVGMSAERSSSRKRAETHVNTRKVVGMSAERSSARKRTEARGGTRKRSEGGRDECRKVKHAEACINMRRRW